MGTTTSTVLRRTAAALATSLLLGACWSDIKEEGHNEVGGDVQTPTGYDSATVPSSLPAPTTTTPSQPGAPADTLVRPDSAVRPPGG